VLLIVAVVLGILLLQVGSRPVVNPTAASATPPTVPKKPPPPTTTTTTLARSSVHVLVANGVGYGELATEFGDELQTEGWSVLPPVNATANVNASNVYYAAGMEPNAAPVAAALGLKTSALLPLTSSVPVSSATGADVVVVIGPDLAAHPPGGSG
jgi:hypothetical protein